MLVRASHALVADQGEAIYKKSFGQKDRETNIPNTDTTQFPITSISKPITAILILKLADRRILGLDDTIDNYFTKTDSQIGKSTIHQLLTHTP